MTDLNVFKNITSMLSNGVFLIAKTSHFYNIFKRLHDEYFWINLFSKICFLDFFKTLYVAT